MKYDFQAIEQRWQRHWEQHRTFRTPNPGEPDFDPAKPKFYVLDMFPYPSGVGLHVGHPLGYIATDIVARYQRMTGRQVLHPMGYDAFGLPAEQFAVEHGVHPAVTTQRNIDNITRQLKRLGLSYDWDRCLATTDVNYYRWTQWIFLQLYRSYFDPIERKAKPIAHLISQLENEELYVNFDGRLLVDDTAGIEALAGAPVGALKWHELSPEEQRQLIDDHRLAYMDEVPVNWCPALGTVLANEEVTNEGRSERGNHPVYKRPLKQWMLRITVYAQRLAEDLELVDWPQSIKLMQRNWIGRSDGALVDFPLAYGGKTVQEVEEVITVFTTRPDTLFGTTYMVLAPEHPLVEQITTDPQRNAVLRYRQDAQRRSDVDRLAETRQKTGVFTGSYAVNPVNDQPIPIWIADYVLMGYGTGAIMAVPGHDQRDFEFAKTFDLPIQQVIAPQDPAVESPTSQSPLSEAYVEPGWNIHSANEEVSLNGLPTEQAKRRITEWLEKKGLGRFEVQYKLRDWLFSRQRYWGEPFPILHAPDGTIVALEESDLPVELPAMDDFSPEVGDDPNAPPRPPLSRAPENWRIVERDGVRYERELNTMPQWAGSCWYYLRFIDPKNEQRFVGQDAERYWMHSRRSNGEPHAGGIDLYVGGAEHAVLHLLYARFWHKVLYDLGYVSTPEPFGRLFNQGYIQAHAYTDSRGMYVPAEEVEENDGRFFHQGQAVRQEFGKMGKSLKNAVAPDDVCEQYGCDTLRLYEMYLGPLDQSKVWNTRDIIGVHRFLQRLWRNFVDEQGALKVSDEAPAEEMRRLLHKTIKRVTDDMERMSFNTAIAALIELNNALVPLPNLPRQVAETMVLLLSPIAPHISEELWSRLGHRQSLACEPWPAYEPTLLIEAEIEYPVMVNGKLRDRITVARDADDQAIEQAARSAEKVQAQIAGKTVRKVIVVKGKMVNIVAG